MPKINMSECLEAVGGCRLIEFPVPIPGIRSEHLQTEYYHVALTNHANHAEWLSP